ncbi:hypothetical protein [Aminobacter phage Erebus]|nr:hypothetical protein [Aminobacter phage Erebus]
MLNRLVNWIIESERGYQAAWVAIIVAGFIVGQLEFPS